MTPSNSKMIQVLTENLNFNTNLSTFTAKNIPKGRPFKDENNYQKLLTQLLYNFEKVQKMTFSTPNMDKKTP